MIIYLLDELISKCELEGKEPKFIEVFESLADARKYGFNFLLGDRKIINLLSNSRHLNLVARNIYAKINHNYTTEIAIQSNCNFRFEIGINESQGEYFHKINIEQFKIASFNNLNKLLLENPNDTHLYREILNYFKVQNGASNVECEFDVMNGGGNTIYEEFSRITLEKRSFTLCLIDSDKNSPSCEYGSTAKQFIDNPISTSWGLISILKVHEIENLIPFQIYTKYINKHHSLNKKILSQLALSNDCDLFNYIDLKNGMKKKRLLGLNSECQNYYSIKFNMNTSDIECKCPNLLNCNCFIFQPLGRTILKKIMNFVSKEGINITDHINDSLVPIYMEMGSKLFDIYCKPRPFKTI
jgi:hypothetical protein